MNIKDIKESNVTPPQSVVSAYRMMMEKRDPHTKNAVPAEPFDSKESPKSKEFKALHKVEIIDGEKEEDDEVDKEKPKTIKQTKIPKGNGFAEGLHKGEKEATRANAANPAVARYRDKTRSKNSGYQFTSFNKDDPKIGEIKAKHKATAARIRVRPRSADAGVERNSNSDAKMKDGKRFDVYVQHKDTFVRNADGGAQRHKKPMKSWNANESVEHLDELSKQLLHRYSIKAKDDYSNSVDDGTKRIQRLRRSGKRVNSVTLSKDKPYIKHERRSDKRNDGLNKAYHKMAKMESVESLDEQHPAGFALGDYKPKKGESMNHDDQHGRPRTSKITKVKKKFFGLGGIKSMRIKNDKDGETKYKYDKTTNLYSKD